MGSFSAVGREFGIDKTTINKCLKRHKEELGIKFKDEVEQELLVSGLKQCSECNKIKKVDEFSKISSNKCKSCYNAYRREYAKNNPDKEQEWYVKSYTTYNDKQKKTRENTRICRDCKKRLPEDCFGDDLYGREKTICIDCCNIRLDDERNLKSKTCTECNIEKDISLFYFNTVFQKYNTKCEDCMKIKRLEWCENNKEERREKSRIKYENNKEVYIKRAAKYNSKMRKTPIGKVRMSIRRTIRRIFDVKDHEKYEEYLGCTIDECRFYIESQFKPGMSWENYGFYGWHIDHKIPVATIKDVNDKEQIKRVCHYTNLQPLWAKENLSKGAKILDGDKNVD